MGPAAVMSLSLRSVPFSSGSSKSGARSPAFMGHLSLSGSASHSGRFSDFGTWPHHGNLAGRPSIPLLPGTGPVPDAGRLRQRHTDDVQRGSPALGVARN